MDPNFKPISINNQRNWELSPIVLLIQFLVFFPTFLFVYLETIKTIIKGWFSFDLSFGSVVCAISVYMIWKKRPFLKQASIKPNLIMGGVITGLGCFMLLAGRFSSTVLLEKVSIIVTILGLVWLVFGTPYLKILILPISYLLFMFPLFDELLLEYSIYFQLAAAKIACTILFFTGIPLVQTGQLIELPHISLEVARGCNGINHIVALVALSVPLGFITGQTVIKKVFLIISAFILGVFLNGLRVALIGIWTHFHREAPIHGPFGILLLSFVFQVGVVLLVLISIIIGKVRLKELFRMGWPKSDSRISPAINHRVITATITSILILCLTGYYINFFKPISVPLKKDLSQIPLVIGDWRGQDNNGLKEPFENKTPDFKLRRIYRNGTGEEIKLYIEYFSTQSQENKVVNYRNDVLHNNAEVLQLSMNSSNFFEIKKTLMNTSTSSSYTYFWYDINGRNIVDRYKAKFATVIDAFTKRSTNAAIVIISTDGDKRSQRQESLKQEIKFIETLFPIIRDCLSCDSKLS